MLSIISVHAAVGDTTIINSHNKTRLTPFGKFDKSTSFPDSLHSFNRILMEFEFGKYPCIGYDPNQADNTGYCADSDYPVQIIVCTPSGDTVEVGRIVTPYAKNRLPRKSADWSHKYWIDVTDYYSLLRNSVTIRLFHSGEHGG